MNKTAEVNCLSGLATTFLFLIIGIMLMLIRADIQTNILPPNPPNRQDASSIMETKLTDSCGKIITFKSLFNSQDEIWIFFLSPSCNTCRSMSKLLPQKKPSNLIFISFSPICFLSSFEDEMKMNFHIYSISCDKAKLFKIRMFPTLVKINSQGTILRIEQDPQRIAVNLDKMSRTSNR